MKKNFNLKFKNQLYFVLIILIFAHQTSFFSNSYIIYKRDYNERLLRNYGYCESHSYGYINKIYNKYLIFEKSQNAFIINFETLPESYGLFPKIKRDNIKNNLILINYQKNNETILNKIKINLKDYVLIDNEKQCFFFKKIK